MRLGEYTSYEHRQVTWALLSTLKCHSLAFGYSSASSDSAVKWVANRVYAPKPISSSDTAHAMAMPSALH